MLDVAVVQFKPRKSDVAANLGAMRDAFAQLAGDARPPGLIVFPEGAVTGYFLEGAVYELAMRADELAAQLNAAWREAAPAGARVDVVTGFYENDGGTYYNSALYARLGEDRAEVVHVHRKMFLATYGVFDEERFLSRGRRLQTFQSAFGTAAILICEDAWHGVTATVAALKGARVLIVPSASPGRGLAGNGHLESVERWHSVLTTYAAEHGVYALYAGLTGFEGGKGMSGSSCIVGPRGDLMVSAGELDACILRATLDPSEVDVARAALPLLGDLGAVLPDLWLDPDLPVAWPNPAEQRA